MNPGSIKKNCIINETSTKLSFLIAINNGIWELQEECARNMVSLVLNIQLKIRWISGCASLVLYMGFWYNFQLPTCPTHMGWDVSRCIVYTLYLLPIHSAYLKSPGGHSGSARSFIPRTLSDALRRPVLRLIQTGLSSWTLRNCQEQRLG